MDKHSKTEGLIHSLAIIGLIVTKGPMTDSLEHNSDATSRLLDAATQSTPKQPPGDLKENLIHK